MKANTVISFLTLVIALITLISCGKHSQTDAVLAETTLMGNPFFAGDAQQAQLNVQQGNDGGTIGGPGNGGNDGGHIPDPSPTPTPTPSASPSPSPSHSPSPTPSASPSPSPSHSPSPTPTCHPSPSPSPSHKPEAGFVRVCSQRRSAIRNFIFFEEAKNPILTVEHLYSFPKPGKKKAGTGRVVLELKTMKGMNLLRNPKPVLPLDIDLTELKSMYPGKSWEGKTLNAYICEDVKHTGRCSDKTGYDVLSIGAVSFQANRIPEKIAFELWSGRGLLLATDPLYCEKQYSPLVLDLKGNGIKLTGPGTGVHFDLDATGSEILTGWVYGDDDAFLVRDLNQNGKIDDGSEMFGSATRLANGKRAANGFEALIDLDSDGNSIFDSKDSAWNEIQLWLDRNYNGETDAGEIISPEQAGMVSIDLNYITKDDVDTYGNVTKQRSLFKKRIGAHVRDQLIIDVWFNTLIPH